MPVNKTKWEIVDSDIVTVTERMKVPGGWLVRSMSNETVDSQGNPYIPSMTMTPLLDAGHSWKLKEEAGGE